MWLFFLLILSSWFPLILFFISIFISLHLFHFDIFLFFLLLFARQTLHSIFFLFPSLPFILIFSLFLKVILVSPKHSTFFFIYLPTLSFSSALFSHHIICSHLFPYPLQCNFCTIRWVPNIIVSFGISSISYISSVLFIHVLISS